MDAIMPLRRRERQHSRRRQDTQPQPKPRLFLPPTEGTDDPPASPSPTKGNGNGNSGHGNGNGSGNGSGNGNGLGNSSPTATKTAPTSKTSDPLGDFLNTVLDPKSKSTSTRTTSSFTPTSTSSSTTRTTPTTTRTTSSSSSSASLIQPSSSTTVLYVTQAATPTLQSATASPSSESNGPGAGPIIGIVAGALAGVAILAVIVGFLVKHFNKNKQDPYEANPFDRDDFQRHSAMLPDHFDDVDDGQRSMSEMHHGAGGYDAGNMAMAGAGLAGGVAAASTMHDSTSNGTFASHNESGGPRPPTMFERHINAPATYAGGPAVGAIFNQGPSPALPPMAFGGGDPYSMAGVGNNARDPALNNSVNPYAHLDRQASHAQQPQQQYNNLDRSGSNGSGGSNGYSPELEHANGAHDSVSPFANPHDSYYQQGADAAAAYDTAGRPGTSEGRSGTPDIPNVQQRYALADEEDEALQRKPSDPTSQGGAAGTGAGYEWEIQASHPASSAGGAAPQYDERVYAASPEPRAASPFGALSQQQQPLQVRNLIPGAQHQQYQQQRPISTASSSGDPADIYGGCV